MPRPDNPVNFPIDLCPECAFLTFWLLQRLALAMGNVSEPMADDEYVNWPEVITVITEAQALAIKIKTHHEELDHTESDDEDE